MTLNSTYHCVPMSINSTAASCIPPGRCNTTRTNTGKSAVAGTEAAICASGCSQAARRGLVPVATPTGMVQAMVRSNATTTRSKVAATPQTMALHWATGTSRSIPEAREIP